MLKDLYNIAYQGVTNSATLDEIDNQVKYLTEGLGDFIAPVISAILGEVGKILPGIPDTVTGQGVTKAMYVLFQTATLYKLRQYSNDKYIEVKKGDGPVMYLLKCDFSLAVLKSALACREMMDNHYMGMPIEIATTAVIGTVVLAVAGVSPGFGLIIKTSGALDKIQDMLRVPTLKTLISNIEEKRKLDEVREELKMPMLEIKELMNKMEEEHKKEKQDVKSVSKMLKDISTTHDWEYLSKIFSHSKFDIDKKAEIFNFLGTNDFSSILKQLNNITEKLPIDKQGLEKSIEELKIELSKDLGMDLSQAQPDRNMQAVYQEIEKLHSKLKDNYLTKDNIFDKVEMMYKEIQNFSPIKNLDKNNEHTIHDASKMLQIKQLVGKHFLGLNFQDKIIAVRSQLQKGSNQSANMNFLKVLGYNQTHDQMIDRIAKASQVIKHYTNKNSLRSTNSRSVFVH